MFNKILVKNGKRVASLLAAALMLCGLAGCSERETVSSAPESVSSVPQSVPDENSEAAQNLETSSDNGDENAMQSIPDAELNDNREESPEKTNAASRSKLREPIMGGSFTVEPPVYPWNDADVKTAWRMTDYYDIMTTFSDCVFLDFTGDDIPEMLMINDGHIFYIFQKSGEEISLLAKSDITALLYDSAFLIDPPMEENGFHYGEVDENYTNINYSRDKFAVFEDSNKQKYIVMFGWSGILGLVCEIKRIEIHGDEITLPVVYRWGLFKELGYDAMNIVMRYKKHLGDDNYEEVPKEEISDFLNSLTICTDLPER